MVSVVLVHVLTMSFGVEPLKSGLCILRTTFTLPLFFFVSGFFLYRPLQQWDKKRIISAIKVRGTALFLGTIVFATIYYGARSGKNTFLWVKNGDFEQYWYTISLFQIFLYYLVVVLLGKIMKAGVTWGIIIAAVVVSFYFYIFDGGEYWCHWWMNKKTLFYIPYFAMGLTVRRFDKKFYSIIKRPMTLTVLIVIFVCAMGGKRELPNIYDSLYHPVIRVVSLIASFSASLLVITIFYTYRDYFDKETRFVRGWRFIGKRTLDIYFIHYFLLPHMRWVGPYMKLHNTFLVELAAGLVVAACVLAVTMGISAILRRAPLIRNLLGAKGPVMPYNKSVEKSVI